MNLLSTKCLPDEYCICCDGFTLPLIADVTGVWKVQVDIFGRQRLITDFDAISGESLVIPVDGFNENYTHSVKLFRPDGSVFEDTLYYLTTINGAGCGEPAIPATESYLLIGDGDFLLLNDSNDLLII